MVSHERDSDLEFDRALQQRAKKMMRAYREAKHWNQQEMADFVGATKASYQKYELPQNDGPDKRNVPMRIVIRFCDRADVDLHYMMTGKTLHKV